MLKVATLFLLLQLLLNLPPVVRGQFSDTSGGGSSTSRRHQTEVQRELRRTFEELLRLELDARGSGGKSNEPVKSCERAALDREVGVFVKRLNYGLKTRMHDLSTANWDYVTNLTQENSAKLEAAQSRIGDYVAEHLTQVRAYLRRADDICSATHARQLKLFANYMLPPVAKDPRTRSRISRLVNAMEETYSTAKITDADGREYRFDPELMDVMATSRDYDRLLWAWQGWRRVTGRRIKSDYVELVQKMNEAAQDNGYADVGVAWQATDFEQTDIEAMMASLYDELKPFYRQLHAHVRRKLVAAYPHRGIDPQGPIPAHLLGDMWAQDWSNVADLALPFPATGDVNVTGELLGAGYTVERMFRAAEDFFESLGLDPMTDAFWAKSVLVRPADNRPMTCHGSAEDFMTDTDFRIKMCTKVNEGDFMTVHHEMGHIEYFMQYRRQPAVFRTGANAAFHEAIGDTIALSVLTPQHLSAIGLIDHAAASQTKEQELNFLMRMALSKVVFLPFAFIMDKWRYEVFRGDVAPSNYNSRWWQLREEYQGVKAPVPRTGSDFDPGCKFHIAANVPYSRYFLSFIGQFQFHSALCKAKGHSGALHTCDIYRSHEAGTKLKSVLRLGASRPWHEAMQLMTGQPRFRADAMLEYFKPLRDWLTAEERNRNSAESDDSSSDDTYPLEKEPAVRTHRN